MGIGTISQYRYNSSATPKKGNQGNVLGDELW